MEESASPVRGLASNAHPWVLFCLYLVLDMCGMSGPFLSLPEEVTRDLRVLKTSLKF